jgi:hypothetical protein
MLTCHSCIRFGPLFTQYAMIRSLKAREAYLSTLGGAHSALARHSKQHVSTSIKHVARSRISFAPIVTITVDAPSWQTCEVSRKLAMCSLEACCITDFQNRPLARIQGQIARITGDRALELRCKVYWAVYLLRCGFRRRSTHILNRVRAKGSQRGDEVVRDRFPCINLRFSRFLMFFSPHVSQVVNMVENALKLLVQDLQLEDTTILSLVKENESNS